MSKKASLQPIRLHFKDVETPVVVTPEDEDRFMTTSAEAASACRYAQNVMQWKQEFDRFLKHLHNWCREHEDTVARTYVAFSHDGLRVFIVTKGKEYQFGFDDTVSQLDLELAQQYPLCPTDVMQLPDTPLEALTSFFTPSESLQVYGH